MYNTKRLDFIRNKYNIYNDLEEIPNTIEIVSKFVSGEPILLFDQNTGLEFISESAFRILIKTDPTKKKLYVQWLTQILINYLKISDHVHMVRMLNEDMNQINSSLNLFDQLKKTKIFKDTAKYINGFSNVKDVCDINQIKSIDRLFTIVDPYIKRDYSGLLEIIKNSIILKQGEQLYEDHLFLVYKPTKLTGSTIFKEYASWCTCKPQNSMFKSYTDRLKPNGSKSDLLVFINKKDLTLFQIHFESRQVNTHYNVNDIEGFKKKYLDMSEGLSIFINDYLINLLKMSIDGDKGKILSDLVDVYADYLFSFGFINDVINLLFKTSLDITVSGVLCKQSLDLYEIKKTKYLRLFSLGLKEFPILNKINEIEIITLFDNSISYFPDDLKPYKNIKSLNLKKNLIKHIPDNISDLDPSNGGSLIYLCITNNQLNDYNKNKLKELLPNVTVVT